MNARRGLNTLIIGSFLAVAITAGAGAPRCWALDADAAREYGIKAAYLYNLLTYVTWPSRDPAAPDDSDIVIGIIGDSSFGQAFDEVRNKKIKGTEKKLIIKDLASSAREDELKGCDVLFVASSERGRWAAIIKGLGQCPVLTVGDAENFIESGGMINLVIIENKMRWEIGVKSIQRSGLRVNSQIIKNAARVIGQ